MQKIRVLDLKRQLGGNIELYHLTQLWEHQTSVSTVNLPLASWANSLMRVSSCVTLTLSFGFRRWKLRGFEISYLSTQKWLHFSGGSNAVWVQLAHQFKAYDFNWTVHACKVKHMCKCSKSMGFLAGCKVCPHRAQSRPFFSKELKHVLKSLIIQQRIEVYA